MSQVKSPILLTFNICCVCGKDILPDDFCHAKTVHDASHKIGRTWIGNVEVFVFRQHHLKCGRNMNAKSLW